MIRVSVLHMYYPDHDIHIIVADLHYEKNVIHVYHFPFLILGIEQE
jgi:hypothetical protein